MKILITGASGFVGGALAHRLLRQGHGVTLLTRKPLPEFEALGAGVLTGDLSDLASLERAAKGQDAVMHVASTTLMWGPWDFFYDNNVVGTRNMVTAAERQGVRNFVFTSSPSVNFVPKDVLNADERIAYSTSTWSSYGMAKALAEQYVLKQNNPPGLRTIALRPHFIWGPGDTHLIPGLLQRARSGRLMQIGSDSVQVDMTYIDNVVEGHIAALMALQTRDVSGRAYFLTQNEPVALWPWARNLLHRLGLPGVRVHVPYPIAWTMGAAQEALYGALRIKEAPPMTRFIAAQLAYSHTYCSDAAMRDLGYQPKVTMTEGLERLLRSYKAFA